MTAYRHEGRVPGSLQVPNKHWLLLLHLYISGLSTMGLALREIFRSTEKAISSILHLLSYHISLTGISSTLLRHSFKVCHQTFIPLDFRCHFPNTLGRNIIRGQPFVTLKFYLARPLFFLTANYNEEIQRTKKRLILKLGETFSSEPQARRRYSEGFLRTAGPLGLEKEVRQQREAKK